MKSKSKENNIIFYVALLIYSGLMFYLFYHQCMLYEDYRFFSDMKAYIQEIQGLNSGYSFPYPIFFEGAKLLSLFLPVYIAIPIILTVLNAVGVYVTYIYFKEQDLNSVISNIGCFAVFLVSMIFLSLSGPADGEYGVRYLGVFSPNPYQNATYIATRPFAILLMIQFIKMMCDYPKCSVKDSILFGVYMILSTLAKPSFIFVIAPVFAVVFIVKWIKKKFRLEKNDFVVIAGALITIAILIWQYIAVFDVDSGGVKFGPGMAWHIWTPSIKEAIIKANLFPFFLLIFHIKDLKKDLFYRYSWIAYLVGILTFYLFYEEGFRFYDANFAWGYMHGLFFVFFSSIVLLLKDWKKYGIRNKWYNWMGSFLLGWHLLCGKS